MEIDLNNGGWEYAPMFNMKFHVDERSLDMTRRRRWHRKMVPDGTLLNEEISNNANSGIITNTDFVFRMQSRVSITKTDQQQTDSSSIKTKEIKIELNAPRMFLSFKSKYTMLLKIDRIPNKST